jgi:hypothetical protein
MQRREFCGRVGRTLPQHATLPLLLLPHPRTATPARTITSHAIPATFHTDPSLIKEFEREARTDGMPARELADRKRTLVNELNSYIALKKNYSGTEDARGELLAGVAAQGEGGGAGVEKTNPYDGACLDKIGGQGGVQYDGMQVGRLKHSLGDADIKAELGTEGCGCKERAAQVEPRHR